MLAFFSSWLLQTVVISTVFFGGYILHSNLLLNAPHGAIEAWNSKIGELRTTVKSNRINLLTGELYDELCAPLEPEDQQNLYTFLSHHKSVLRAERRLQLIRKRGLFFTLSLLVGAAFGALLSVPILVGGGTMVKQVPTVSVFLGAFTSIVFVGMLSWPQAVEWTDLKDATSRIK